MKKTWVAVLIILLLVLVVGGYVWSTRPRVETTDNAQVEADVVPISSEVAGRIVGLHVQDNERVKKGQLLVEIERVDYSAKVEQARTAVNSALQRQAAAQAQLELTRRQARAALQEQASGVQVAQANVATAATGIEAARERYAEAAAGIQAAQANVGRARSGVTVAQAELTRVSRDVQRYRQLYSKEEISRQQYEAILTQQAQAQARLQAARREVDAAQAQVQQSRAGAGQASEGIGQTRAALEESRSRVGEAQARLESARTGPERVAVAAAQVKVVQAEVAQARAALQLAEQDLKRTKIYAPSDGVVTKRSAQMGALAGRGVPLLALVVQPRPWVVANFKETQMEHIRPGTRAEVSIDTYPGKVFQGHVESVQAGTGARFSLLPPENAAGSFVKVVQRIPVRIVLDQLPAETPLVPGMSAEVAVRIQ